MEEGQYERGLKITLALRAPLSLSAADVPPCQQNKNRGKSPYILPVLEIIISWISLQPEERTSDTRSASDNL